MSDGIKRVGTVRCGTGPGHLVAVARRCLIDGDARCDTANRRTAVAAWLVNVKDERGLSAFKGRDPAPDNR